MSPPPGDQGRALGEALLTVGQLGFLPQADTMGEVAKSS